MAREWTPPLDGTEPLPAFICPISQEIMIDPVMTSDGHTYDRQCIMQWFEQGNTRSPLTNLPLEGANWLIPNRALLQASMQQQERMANINKDLGAHNATHRMPIQKECAECETKNVLQELILCLRRQWNKPPCHIPHFPVQAA